MKIREEVAKTKMVYIADDGKQFLNRNDCEIYEKYSSAYKMGYKQN